MNATVGKTILVALYPEYGAYNASLMLARRLTERGFKVLYLTDRRFDAHLRQHGFETVIFNGIDDLRLKGGEWRSLGRLRRSVVATRLKFEMAVEACAFMERWLENNPVELVLLDPLVYELAAPMLKLGVPVLGLNATLASIRNSSAPPVFSGRAPSAERRVLSRSAVFFSWLRFDLRWLHAQLVQPLLQMFFVGPVRYWHCSPLRAIKRHGGRVGWGEYGFRLIGPELVMAPREFDLPNVCQRTVRCYVGAC